MHKAKIFHPPGAPAFELRPDGAHKRVDDQTSGDHRVTRKMVRINGICGIEEKVPLVNTVRFAHPTAPIP